MKTTELFSLENTIAKSLLEKHEYPWQALSDIKEFTVCLGKSLNKEIYDEISENVWIAKSAKIFSSAHISPPCIIDECSEIRHCAFIRGGAIIGKNCVVGNSTELKNCIIFDSVQIPHYNYCGGFDSWLSQTSWSRRYNI